MVEIENELGRKGSRLLGKLLVFLLLGELFVRVEVDLWWLGMEVFIVMSEFFNLSRDDGCFKLLVSLKWDGVW